MPQVYCILPGPLPPSTRRIAGCLYGGKTARLTGLSAAAHLGWRIALTHEHLVVRVDNECRVPSTDFVTIIRSRVDGSVKRAGILVAKPELILIDSASCLVQREATALVAVAVQRREASITELRALITSYPRLPGSAAIRGAIVDLATGAESIKEVDTLKLTASLGHPAPACQMWIFSIDGTFICICDFYWDGVVGFYDGASHLSRESQLSDGLKRTQCESLDLQVVIVTNDLLKNVPLFDRRVSAALRNADTLAKARRGPAGWIALTAEEARARQARP